MKVKQLKHKLIYVVYEYDNDHEVKSMAAFESVYDAKQYLDVLVFECKIDIRSIVLVDVPFALA